MRGEKFNGGSVAVSFPSPTEGLKTAMKKVSKTYGKFSKGLYKTSRDCVADPHKLPGVLFSDTGSVYSIETSATHGLRKKGHGWTISTPTATPKAIEYGHPILENRVDEFRSWESVISFGESSWSDDDSVVSHDTLTPGFFCGLIEDVYDDKFVDTPPECTEDDLDDIFINSPFARAFLGA